MCTVISQIMLLCGPLKNCISNVIPLLQNSPKKKKVQPKQTNSARASISLRVEAKVLTKTCKARPYMIWSQLTSWTSCPPLSLSLTLLQPHWLPSLSLLQLTRTFPPQGLHTVLPLPKAFLSQIIAWFLPHFTPISAPSACLRETVFNSLV